MFPHSKTSPVLLCSLAAAIHFGVSTAHAVGLNISPSTITNDFVGKLTLNISGLTPGKTVNILIYGDLNANGVVDSGEPIVQAFTVTDGLTPTIGSVRNLNVPRDEDGSANGQIQTELFLPGVGVALIADAHFVFQVVDPSGNAVLASQPYIVAPRVRSQGITGRLTAAATGQPLPYTIMAFQGIGAPAPLFTVTDANGNFICQTLPLTYGVLIYESGFIDPVTNQVVVSCGKFTTNNFSFTAGSLFISGKVTDNATGIGLPGIGIAAQSTNAVFSDAFTFTDINGNYTLAVTGTNQWGIKPDQGSVSARGYMPVNSRTKVPISSANVSGVDFTLTNATALIYGTILDNNHHPVVGMQMTANDSGGLFDARAESVATNGAYSIAVAAGARWNVMLGPSDLLSRGYPPQLGTNVAVIAGQATNINFVITRTNSTSLASPVNLAGNQFQFLLNGLAGRDYTIQTLDNLGGTNWQAILATNTPCDSLLLIDPLATNNSRFYRILVAP